MYQEENNELLNIYMDLYQYTKREEFPDKLRTELPKEQPPLNNLEEVTINSLRIDAIEVAKRKRKKFLEQQLQKTWPEIQK